MISGVPQGSVMGSLLFIMFINDLSKCCDDNSRIFIFADDAKCFSRIDSYLDCVRLQATLTSIENWSVRWQLPLSINKCKVMYFHCRSTLLKFQYCVFNCVLPSVDSISDLGVIFSCDLSFNMQVDKLCSKARCRAAMILRSFQSRDCKLLFRAFTVYVRPILEYCSNVWSPYRLVDIRRIESVQRFFTKRLRGLKDMTYVERLECLNADSLECRRMKTDLGMYHKILHGLVDIEPDSFFQVRNGCTRSNGLSLTLEDPEL